MNDYNSNKGEGPWNPGVVSELPRHYLPLSTMFRPENVAISMAKAQELSDFCDLPDHTLVAFRADRLIVHELLIRVTADIAVPDGSRYADLGINFREIASTIQDQYIAPHRDQLVALLDDIRRDAGHRIRAQLDEGIDEGVFGQASGPLEPEEDQSLLSRILFARQHSAPSKISPEDTTKAAILYWQRKSEAAGNDAFERSCCDALIQIVTAISGARGRLVGEPELIANLAATLACNEHGSDRIGEVIKPYITEAVAAENLNFLPVQDKPVVLNVKGASAAGKSTMRPLQKTLTERLGIPWEDFALVSPDIWRKFLLDYDSLGPAYKYAGTLTGHELEIIDRKLDRYMARKARDGRMSHLLIDRFRFDSFVPESDTSEDSKLLTRFGDLVYMFFVITPPDATVERAWQRGLKFGRYKAVDDLLDHNVEAFTGMPNLSFTWALRTRKLTGIVEADETCVPESRKGARNLERKARRRGGKASKRGLSDEQVPVLVVADRSGATVSAVLPAVNADTLREVIAPVVDEDAGCGRGYRFGDRWTPRLSAMRGGNRCASRSIEPVTK